MSQRCKNVNKICYLSLKLKDDTRFLTKNPFSSSLNNVTFSLWKTNPGPIQQSIYMECKSERFSTIETLRSLWKCFLPPLLLKPPKIYNLWAFHGFSKTFQRFSSSFVCISLSTDHTVYKGHPFEMIEVSLMIVFNSNSRRV